MSQSRALLAVLHDRVLSGDRSVSAELFVRLHAPISRTIFGRFRGSGLIWEDAADLATDAMVSYLDRPQLFDPARASLFTYLVLIANGDALNLLRNRVAEQRNFARLVELSGLDGNIVHDDESRRLEAAKLLREHLDEIAETAMDRSVLRLMLEGEQDTPAYAAAMQIGHLSEAEQRRMVKQARDKIEKRLRRLGERLC